MDSVIRSYLFVPSNRSDLIYKALNSNSDAIILDLEDSIPYDQKNKSRENINNLISKMCNKGKHIFVRVNSELLETLKDLNAIDIFSINGIVLPKLESIAQLDFVEEYLNEKMASYQKNESISILGIIETARGLNQLNMIAKQGGRLTALALGSEDLALDLGASPITQSLILPCQLLVLAAKSYGIQALGFPGSIANFKDLALLTEQLELASLMGLDGALAIHPKQIELINQVFYSSENEIKWAHQVIDAMENSQSGVGVIDGNMIDKPVLEKAYRILSNQRR